MGAPQKYATRTEQAEAIVDVLFDTDITEASTVGAMTCEEIAVAVGDDATEKGVALTMSGLSRRGLVRWSWVQRGGARARKGYSIKPVDGAA